MKKSRSDSASDTSHPSEIARHQAFYQVLLASTFLPLCWLGMMVVHELGHVLGALFTGGTVERVVLHPLAISRTDLSVNPSPLPTAWAGPVFGVVLPVVAWAICRTWRLPGWHLWQFFAGFCLIANGAYIGVGAFVPVGDAADVLDHGTGAWQLLAFGLLTFPAGLWLWNGLGPRFGFGPSADRVNPSTAYTSCGLLLLLIALELVLAHW